jgi:hypothetical protein
MITVILELGGVMRLRYRGLMTDLPDPILQVDISEYQERADEILAVVDAGGAVLLWDDKREWLLGALSRHGWPQEEALLARDIANGTLPPLDVLVREADAGTIGSSR